MENRLFGARLNYGWDVTSARMDYPIESFYREDFFKMRTFIKSCLSVMATGLLVVSMHARADDAAISKEKLKTDPVIKCQLECNGIKDNAAYEGCMIKCKEDHKDNNPIVPLPKK